MDKHRTLQHGLVALGLSCLCAGIALALAKHLHPVAGQYAAGVGRALANGGILAVAGLGFVALGWSARGRQDDARELLLEQVAADLVQLRTRLDSASAAPSRVVANDDDRLFRLAAAIDQLGARLEARLKTHHAQSTTELERLRADLAQRSPLEQDATTDEDRAAPRPLDEEGDPWLSTPEPEIELDGGYEPGDEDLEIVVELEDEDDDSPGLGILDDIEEGRAVPPPEPPDSALPGIGLHETNLAAKLAALRDLMGDPAVRAALDASRRAG